MNALNEHFKNTLIAGLKAYEYDFSQEQIDKLTLFNNLVMETNKHTNLTAIENGPESAKKHFLDSLNPVAMEMVKASHSIIDVGSGAGFPGIPLAVMNTHVNFTLLDTRKKRCEFMEQAAAALNLNNVNVVWSRAEELGKDEAYREKFDIACARALAAMPTLLEYLAPFVKTGGHVMLYKGSSSNDEISAAETAAEILGLDTFDASPYNIYNENVDYAMVVGKKIKSTPAKYPRKAGIPTKRPL